MTDEQILKRELPRYVGNINFNLLKGQENTVLPFVALIKKCLVSKLGVGYEIEEGYNLKNIDFIVKPILKRLTKEAVEEMFELLNGFELQPILNNDLKMYSHKNQLHSFYISKPDTFPKILLDALYEKGVNVCIPDHLVIYED